MEIDQIAHNSQLYRKLVSFARDVFASSETKEELNARMEFLFRITSGFFLRNGPRNRQKQHVLEKLAFYKENISPGSSVVDVGCFDGYYTQQLREYGCDIVGVDANRVVLAKTRKLDPKGRYVDAFAESLPFPAGSFDVGLYSHILHHVLEPEVVIKEARRVVKENGQIIVAVPLALGTDANHLRSFNREQLESLVGACFPNITYFSKIGIGHGCIASGNRHQ